MVNRRTLQTSVSELPGVGIKLEATLNRLGIHRIQDLLFHLPFRYLDRTRLTPIGSLQIGREALIEGIVELSQIRYGRRRQLLCQISDGTGALAIRLFHFSRYQHQSLTRGAFIRCWGSPRRQTGKMEMIHPEYKLIPEERRGATEETLTPVYPTTEGLTQTRLRRLTGMALDILEQDREGPRELLPGELLKTHALPDLLSALKYVHRPPPEAELEQLSEGRHVAQQRLAFEELLAHQLSLKAIRKRFHQVYAPPVRTDERSLARFIQDLPFRLTGAQTRVLQDIRHDLCKPTPMLRLIQGDVGSGKTVLAAIAALIICDGGYQAAYMAPTELLAEQHYAIISGLFAGTGFPIIRLTGSMTRKTRKEVLEQIQDPSPAVIIGTHALFQEEVGFGRLGLVIIDEQHRFGVSQRLALLEKGMAANNYPHQMVMTATPIPRTLMMTAFADLDLSVIDELPPGRIPVRTVALSNERRNEIIERIATVCKQGHQAYWVCTLVEESENLQVQAAEETMEFLTDMLPLHRIGLVHGRMKAKDKEKVMRECKTGQLDVLVATTVIEVGVDVPAASLMIIENAERLGLSQLHQLRGRVGRGNQSSHCVLLYQPPLTDTARARLEIMRATNDGFEIANRDMELRGPGEILGLRQTGLPSMRVADLMRDYRLIPSVQAAADYLIESDPDCTRALIHRWLPQQQNYGNV